MALLDFKSSRAAATLSLVSSILTRSRHQMLNKCYTKFYFVGILFFLLSSNSIYKDFQQHRHAKLFILISKKEAGRPLKKTHHD